MARFEKCALCGLAVFVLAACTALFTLAIDTPRSSAQGQKQAASTSADKCDTKLRLLGLNVGAASDKSVSEGADKREKADLCQQIRMADAAEEAASIAWLQYIAGLIGLAGLGMTVLFTGWTAWAASKAAVAANMQAHVAQQTLASLERPYIFITDLRSRIAVSSSIPHIPYVESVARNCGRAPGVLKKSWYALRIVESFPEMPPLHDNGMSNLTALQPDAATAVFACEASDPCDDVVLRDLKSGKLKAVFVARITYRDASGSRNFEAGFGWVWQPSSGSFVSNESFAGIDNPGYNYDREEKRQI